MYQVSKRDGKVVDFDISKIAEAIKKAFQAQMQGRGFTFVELLTNCPTNWHMSPVKTLEFIEQQTSKYFPLGVYVDKTPKEEK